MANHRHNIPPPDGSLDMNVNDTVTFHAARACTLCCNIGRNFSPNMTNVQLSAGDTTFTAITAGNGKYNTSDPGVTCNPQSLTLVAQSVQINP